MEIDLWGNPIRRSATYYVYHDESIPNKRWLLVGLLMVRAQDLGSVRQALAKCRKDERYDGEIHFSRLPSHFTGKWGAKARVARAWMHLYEQGLCEKVFCSILCVDRASPCFDPSRFPRDFHAYNRFTATALKAAIVWHLDRQELDELYIHFVSDAKERTSRPGREMMDNFETYIPYRAELDAFLAQAKGRSYPNVQLTLELKNSAEEDLIQLCDVLLGATQMALIKGSHRETKHELAKYIIRWYEDLQRPKRQQSLDLYQKFNVWAFPDHQGKPYKKVPFALQIDDRQLRFPYIE